jgi:hypothetical protein
MLSQNDIKSNLNVLIAPSCERCIRAGSGWPLQRLQRQTIPRRTGIYGPKFGFSQSDIFKSRGTPKMADLKAPTYKIECHLFSNRLTQLS